MNKYGFKQLKCTLPNANLHNSIPNMINQPTRTEILSKRIANNNNSKFQRDK